MLNFAEPKLLIPIYVSGYGIIDCYSDTFCGSSFLTKITLSYGTFALYKKDDNIYAVQN